MNASHTHRALAVVLLSTAMFSAMGGPALAPALPSIQHAYAHIPHIDFWTKTLIAITGLFSAVGAPLFGWISDRWGRRRALVLALLGWGVFGSSGLMPQPFWTLLAGRAALGVSLGGLLSANSAMIADSFEQDRRRAMMGLQSSFSSTGVVLALIASGWLAHTHWRLSFGIFLSAFAILPFLSSCPEPTRAKRESAVVRPPRVFTGGLAALCFFGFMVMFGFTIIPTQLPFFMNDIGIRGASRMGLFMTVMPIASALTGRCYARVSHGIGTWNLFLYAGLAMLAGFHVLSRATGPYALIAGQAIVGIGCGMAMPHVNVVLARLTPQEARGRAMGLLTGSKFMGQFFSPILLEPVLNHGGYGSLFATSGWLMMGTAAAIWAWGRWIKHQGATA